MTVPGFIFSTIFSETTHGVLPFPLKAPIATSQRISDFSNSLGSSMEVETLTPKLVCNLLNRLRDSSKTRMFAPKPKAALDAYSPTVPRSEEHTSELQSRGHLVCRLLLEKKKLEHL